MTVIDKLHAIAATDPAPLRYVPTNLDPRTLVGVLQRLNLVVPAKLSAAAFGGQPPSASGHRFTIKEVDAALVNANVGISDRIRLKAAMGHSGIMER